uniref:Cellulose synthase operon protein D n=1 Tax=Komagataeibacter xylinus TaxID=28448 RepID=UPI0001E30605|nr:Chain A, Cellulose synthase operon protein D [Komagataeibacter xylinus]3A8E_B Chain B, Cellulose synthase operon protein D [Komagataeibacter xylinus]3A8E_C Chain C, Cellulose synthase operon protein D [Komagataeibacter xylinus]3A8E_D Chain D, Cellulose synthase operon protein D [Komagataeibacter xylinus]3AJ2_A Chain A, Cellulose synthase operon protein D [Komagataeibacter xylinus]3AJ2_B Chain B, Cellulose synthase operon protein D [Komagataeibacter xylinus]3AJ2_C Chain C, Cellulose synthas
MTIFEKKPDFTLFLQTLSWEIDDQVGIEVRNELLREVGRGMGTRIMPPPCQTVDKLQIELNALLALIGWGTVTLELLSEDQSLRIVHENLPQVGSAGEPSGTWLAPVLEGLYGRWVTSQAGAFGDYVVTRDVDAEDLNAVPRQTIIMYMRVRSSATHHHHHH